MEAIIVDALIKIVLPQVLKAVMGGLQVQQTRADQINLGRTQVASDVNKEDADAQRRASEVTVNMPDVDRMLADLAAGKPW